MFMFQLRSQHLFVVQNSFQRDKFDVWRDIWSIIYHFSKAREMRVRDMPKAHTSREYLVGDT